MAVSIKWDNHNKTVLRLFFWNEWTLEEYIELFQEAITMFESVKHDVDLLIDLRTGEFIPKFDTIPTFRKIMDSLPENAGILVYVSENDTQRYIFNIHLKFYESIRKHQPRRFFFLEDIPQAYELIEEYRPESEVVDNLRDRARKTRVRVVSSSSAASQSGWP